MIVQFNSDPRNYSWQRSAKYFLEKFDVVVNQLTAIEVAVVKGDGYQVHVKQKNNLKPTMCFN